jgi:hypothetical protein
MTMDELDPGTIIYGKSRKDRLKAGDPFYKRPERLMGKSPGKKLHKIISHLERKTEVDSELGKSKKRYDDETTKHLLPPKELKEVNLALLEGLKLSVHVMKNWDQLGEGRRQSLIRSVDGLIAQIEMIYQIDRSQQ